MVIISKALMEQFPAIAESINYHLKLRCIDVKEIDSLNLWCRDFMPIKSGSGYTKFQYKIDNKYPQLYVDEKCWSWMNPSISDIVLDGGNVVQNSSKVFMTEIVFKHNRGDRSELKQRLEDIFNKELVFLPVEPGDDLGHSDGILNFISEKKVFINDHSFMNSAVWFEYSKTLERILTKHDIEFVKIPWAYPKMPELTEQEFRVKYPYADEQNEGFGYYVNYFHIEDLVLMPIFHIEEDRWALDIMRRNFPQHDIIPVDCSDLSMLGGLLHCVTYGDE